MFECRRIVGLADEVGRLARHVTQCESASIRVKLSLSLLFACFHAIGGAADGPHAHFVEKAVYAHRGVSVHALSANGDLLATAGEGILRVWSLRKNKIVYESHSHWAALDESLIARDVTTTLVFALGDTAVVSCGRDGRASVHYPATGRCEPIDLRLPYVESKSNAPCPVAYVPMWDLCVARDTSRLFVALGNGICEWDLENRKEVGMVCGSSRLEAVTSRELLRMIGDPSRKGIARALLDTNHRLCYGRESISDHTELWYYTEMGNRLAASDETSVSTSSDGRLVLVCRKGAAFVFETKSRDCVLEMRDIRYATLAPSGTVAVVRYHDHKTSVVEIGSAMRVCEAECAISCVPRYTADGSRICAASHNEVFILRGDSLQTLAKLSEKDRAHSVAGVSCSDDGDVVAVRWRNWRVNEVVVLGVIGDDD